MIFIRNFVCYYNNLACYKTELFYLTIFYNTNKPRQKITQKINSKQKIQGEGVLQSSLTGLTPITLNNYFTNNIRFERKNIGTWRSWFYEIL